MILTDKQVKLVKWISYIFQILLIIAVIVLGTMNTKKRVAIKQKNTQIEILVNEKDSLQKLCKSLGNQDCITINCSVNIKAPNILGQQNLHADAVAKTVATITRQEMLSTLDSLNSANMDDIKLDTITTQNGAKVIVGNKKK